jgi:predicted membrane protein
MPRTSTAEDGRKTERQLTIPVPKIDLRTPSTRDLAMYGGVATLALLSVIDWPVAAVAAATYVLARNGTANGNGTRNTD